jgi:hypothetical protein
MGQVTKGTDGVMIITVSGLYSVSTRCDEMPVLKSKKDKKTGMTREQRLAKVEAERAAKAEQDRLRREQFAQEREKAARQAQVDADEEMFERQRQEWAEGRSPSQLKRKKWSKGHQKAVKPCKPGKVDVRKETLRRIDEAARMPACRSMTWPGSSRTK